MTKKTPEKVDAVCPVCEGTGRDKPESTCPLCEGTGKPR